MLLNRIISLMKIFLEECNVFIIIKWRILKVYDCIFIFILVYDYFDIFLEILIWEMNLNILFWLEIDFFNNKFFVVILKF